MPKVLTYKVSAVGQKQKARLDIKIKINWAPATTSFK